jgi:hypothetical protein
MELWTASQLLAVALLRSQRRLVQQGRLQQLQPASAALAPAAGRQAAGAATSSSNSSLAALLVQRQQVAPARGSSSRQLQHQLQPAMVLGVEVAMLAGG